MSSNIYKEYILAKYGEKLKEFRYTVPETAFYNPAYGLNGKTATLTIYSKNMIELVPNRVGSMDQGVKYAGDVNEIMGFKIIPRVDPDDYYDGYPFLIIIEAEKIHIYETTADPRNTGGIRYYFAVDRPSDLTADKLGTITGLELPVTNGRLETAVWKYCDH
jgi:hypothetical protein